MRIIHGPAVETRADWIFEGVWDGEFENGNFDESEVVFGSGVRVRGDTLTCVSSSSTLDRLWVFEFRGCWWVANTLPGALAASGQTIDMSYPRYREDIESVVSGLRKYKRFLPLSSGEAEIVYFDNVRLGAHGPKRIEKPRVVSAWSSFEEYRQFLSSTAGRIRANAEAPTRRVRYEVVATISSGYDSTASAVVAREAGATRAVTLRRARALVPRADTGENIAAALGLTCTTYEPDLVTQNGEEWFLAALGWSMDFNLAAFEYPSHRVTVLFTGFHGDKFWDLHEGKPNDELIRGDPSGLGFTEYRLVAGIINCAVPFWGVRHAAAMKTISRSSSLKAWTTGTGYDRPIPRRMAEDAGVARHLFGQRKSATTIAGDVYWPASDLTERSFRKFLRARGRRGSQVISLIRLLNQLEMVVLKPLRARTGLRWPRVWIQVQESQLLFGFAVSLISERLRALLSEVPETPSTPL